MRLHGRVADEKLLADLGVGQALRDQSEHVHLSSSQGVHGGRGRSPQPGELADYGSGDARGEEGVPFGDRADSGEKLFGRIIFEDEPTRTGLQGFEDVVVEGMSSG